MSVSHDLPAPRADKPQTSDYRPSNGASPLHAFVAIETGTAIACSVLARRALLLTLLVAPNENDSPSKPESKRPNDIRSVNVGDVQIVADSCAGVAIARKAAFASSPLRRMTGTREMSVRCQTHPCSSRWCTGQAAKACSPHRWLG